jgi:uncharacterized membrane protein
MSDKSTSTVTIQSTASEIQEVLSNLSAYPTWSTTIKSVNVITTDDQGRATQVQVSVDAGALKDKPTLNYDWSKAPNRLEFSLEDADLLTEMSGAYIIKDNGDDTTDVTYELTVGLSMPVPAVKNWKIN